MIEHRGGAELLGRWSEDGEYGDCVVEEVRRPDIGCSLPRTKGRTATARNSLGSTCVSPPRRRGGRRGGGRRGRGAACCRPRRRGRTDGRRGRGRGGAHVPRRRRRRRRQDGRGRLGRRQGRLGGIPIPAPTRSSRGGRRTPPVAEDEEGDDDIEVGAELLGRWSEDGGFDCVVEGRRLDTPSCSRSTATARNCHR